MTNTMRDRFEEWVSNHLYGRFNITRRNNVYESIQTQLMWTAYKAAHADMLPVLERVREALVWANRAYGLPYSDAGKGGVLDAAIGKTREALTELEAIMKQQGEKI